MRQLCRIAWENSARDNNRPTDLAKMIINSLASDEKLKALKQASADNVIKFDLNKWTTRLEDFLTSLKELE